ncbi:MAG: TRAP transporter small permease subunit [Alphaproteobacteria bacterium]|nr:TRAP transporter small permease subunit [Alphaproteobacteria bacterium]
MIRAYLIPYLWAAGAVTLLPLFLAAIAAGRKDGTAGLAAINRVIDAVNTGIGRTIAWFALFMVLLQTAIVVARYAFGLGSVFAQEAMLYLHGTLFLAGAAYTLLKDGHVRVDILYRAAPPAAKEWINLTGAYLMLFPVAILLFFVSFPYVAQSWANFEGSRETSGIEAIFLLKSMILVFAALLYLQGLSLVAQGLLRLLGRAPLPADDARRV